MELGPLRKLISSAPLLIPSIALATGIWLSTYSIGFLILIVGILLSLISYFCHRHYLALISASFSLGSLSLMFYQSRLVSLPVDSPLIITADIIESKETNSGQTIIAAINSIADKTDLDSYDISSTKISITVPSLIPAIKPGYEIKAKMILKNPDTRVYLPDQFNYGNLLLSKDIRYTSFLLSKDIVTLKPSNSVSMRFRRLREDISLIILQLPLRANTKIFLNTVLTGNTDSFDIETRQAFSQSGLAHILALSGLHIAIFSAILFYLLFPLRLVASGRFIPALIILCLWFYALLTGMSPSVTRATVMATVFLSALMLQRPHNPLNSLCFAAMLILVFDPKALFDISFQLSFLAVVGILIFAKKLNPISPRKRFFHPIFAIFAVSIAAMSFAGVLSAYYFHSFPLFFLISNVIVSPILPIFMALGIAMMILSYCGIDIPFLTFSVDLLYQPIDKITQFFYNLPFSGIQDIYFDGVVLILLFLFIITLAFVLYHRRLAAYLSSVATLLALIITISISNRTDSEGVFIVPSSSRTELYFTKDKTLNVVTTAPTSEFASLSDQISNFHSDFLKKRSIKSVNVISDKDFGKYPETTALISFPNGNIAFCSSNMQSKKIKALSKIDYLIVCKGFTGDILDLLQECSVGTLILSSDLHPSRHDRYLAQCNQIGQRVISLRNEMPPMLSHLL